MITFAVERTDEKINVLGQLCRCIPRGAAESRSLSGVTATAESTPGSTDTVISPLESGGVCVCAGRRDSDRETEEVRCVSVLEEGERKGKRLEEIVYACAYVCVCLLNI